MSLYALDIDNNTDPDISGVLRSLGHWQGERALRTKKGRVLWAEVALRLVNPQRPEEGFIASLSMWTIVTARSGITPDLASRPHPRHIGLGVRRHRHA